MKVYVTASINIDDTVSIHGVWDNDAQANVYVEMMKRQPNRYKKGWSVEKEVKEKDWHLKNTDVTTVYVVLVSPRDHGAQTDWFYETTFRNPPPEKYLDQLRKQYPLGLVRVKEEELND